MAAMFIALTACTGTRDDSTPVPTIAAGVGSDVTVISGNSGTTSDTTDPLSFPAFGDPAAPILVAVGQHFALMMAADPTSGFHWTISQMPDPAVVSPLGTQFMTSQTAMTSSPDSEILSFVAIGEGETEIALRYTSADTELDSGTREAVFTVTVTADGKPPPTSVDANAETDPGLNQSN